MPNKEQSKNILYTQNSDMLIQELEGQRLLPKNTWQYWMVFIIAISWSFYQLYVVVVPTDGVFLRPIHLAFAVALAFAMYPMFRNKKTMFYIPWYNFILAPMAVFAFLYTMFDYENLIHRISNWNSLDIFIGILGIILLLKASRRSLGLALPIIAIVFLCYNYLGSYMPEIIAHKGASISKIVGHIFFGTEGIFGVPLGVSASYVFLFVLFGALLERAGAGKYFIDIAFSLLGKYDGGPAKASVAASGMMGIVSGSSIANTVTTGTFTIPLMKKTGFPSKKAAAVEVAASTNGQLMPPVMGAAAFIIAEYLGISYTSVITAAIIPAFVSYFALFFIVHLEAKKLGIKGDTSDKLVTTWEIFKKGIHFLIPIFFLIYTLVVLRESAEMAAFNAIIFLIIVMFFQHQAKALIDGKSISWKYFEASIIDIANGMVNGAKNMVPVAIATSVAGIVVGSVTLTSVGLVLTDVISQLSGGYIIGVLFFTAIVSLILGMGLPTTANYIVMASLTAPVIITLSGDLGYLVPAIAVHLFVFYFGILADSTPPVGLAAYAAAGIARSNPIKTGLQGFLYDIRTALLPFMFFFNSKLLLIESIDPLDPSNYSLWNWVTNPFEIILIFVTATIGMFAFSSFVQGYFIKKITLLDRVMLFCVIPLMLIPNRLEAFLNLPNEYFSYLIGFFIYGAVFWMQKNRKVN